MSSTDSKTRFTAIVAAIIVCLLAFNAYQLYNKVQLDKANAQLTQEVNEVEKLKLDLEKQYYEALSELESMKTGNEELNALIDQQKQELEEKKKKISRMIGQGKRSTADLSEAREQISLLRAQLDGYVADVNNLKIEKDLLTEANQQLSSEKEALQSNLSEERTMNEELVSAKAALVSEKEDLENTREQLSKKVTYASVVRVNDVVGTSWKVRKSGKPAKTNSAAKTDRIKVCFTTLDNDIAPKGTEEFYIRLINPVGETLAVEDLGSGIMNSAKGEEVRYTQIKELDYQNSPMVGCFLWEPNLPFQKGTYSVEVYNKGHLAGSGSFRLK